AELPCFIGVDLGGTNIKIGVLDTRGRTLAFERIPTREPQGPEQAIRRIAETCRSIATKIGIRLEDIPRAGLGAPGPMCLKRGMLLEPVNLPNWAQFKIQAELAELLELPVSFVNDANA